MQGGQARREEIISALYRDEAWQLGAKEWRPASAAVARDHHAPRLVIVADQRILVPALPEVVATVDPLLLHELELGFDARHVGEENDAARAVVRRLRLGHEAAIGNAAPDYA